MQLTLGMYGDGDFYTMKGVVEEFFEKTGLHDHVTYDPKSGRPYLHPGRQADIIYKKQSLAISASCIRRLRIITASASALTWQCWICRQWRALLPSTASLRALQDSRQLPVTSVW